jgi:hypothetical protein
MLHMLTYKLSTLLLIKAIKEIKEIKEAKRLCKEFGFTAGRLKGLLAEGKGTK